MSKQKKNGMQTIWRVAIVAAIACASLTLLTHVKFGTVPQETAMVENTLTITEETPIVSEKVTEEPVVKETPVIVEEPVVEKTEEVILPEYDIYIVQPGDNLWSIANLYYGDGNLYKKIAADNDISNPNIVSVGQELKIYNADVIPEPVVETVAQTIPEPNRTLTSYNQTSNEVDISNMEYVGNFRITGYDPLCVHCCGKSDGITASGRKAVYNYSVGCNSLPLGTELYIEGYGYYRVDDRGGMAGDLIDIACESHAVCYTVTNYNVPVYIVK